jgi:hypothetical protein
VPNPLVQSTSSSVEASYQRDGLISELSTSVPPSEAGDTEGKPLSEEQSSESKSSWIPNAMPDEKNLAKPMTL